MTRKVLFCATLDIHFEAFHLPYLKWFKEQGFEIHTASAGNRVLPYVDQKHQLTIERMPFRKENISAYNGLKKIINEHQFQIIHCHTPMGGVLSRMAARQARKKGTKVLYTAHGFHFYKGAPKLNWLVYYPIEKYLARWTDCLITINSEDYHIAKNKRFRAGAVEQVHGVGVDPAVYHPVNQFNKAVLRAQKGYSEDDFLMFYGAEFNLNKNQELLIRSAALIKEKIPRAKLILAGDGPHLAYCRELAEKLEVGDLIHFVGFRNDMDSWLKMSDIAVASSFREGLPVNMMEAMACGLPIIATKNRGHLELVIEERNGFIIENNDPAEFSKKILHFFHRPDSILEFGMESHKMIHNRYTISKVLEEKSRIYTAFMEREDESLWAAL